MELKIRLLIDLGTLETYFKGVALKQYEERTERGGIRVWDFNDKFPANEYENLWKGKIGNKR